jgi:hypothetical protein
MPAPTPVAVFGIQHEIEEDEERFPVILHPQ